MTTKTTKQTIVEMRFPVTEEVLNTAAVTLQRDGGNVYYSFVFATDGSSKDAAKRARAYLNDLFNKSLAVSVTQIETKAEETPDESHIMQESRKKAYSSEDNV